MIIVSTFCRDAKLCARGLDFDCGVYLRIFFMKTIGIIGSGQLAQLLAMSSYQLGLKTLCFANDAHCPASRLSPIFTAHLDDQKALNMFAKQVDVITIENENINTSVLDYLTLQKSVYPNTKAVEITQDRLLEKTFFQQHNIKTTDFFSVDSIDDFTENKLNGILKTRRLGYDGKGQIRIKPDTDLQTAWNTLKQPAIYESFVDFDFEVSLLIARNIKGDMQAFPLIHNTHHDGILRISRFLNTDAKYCGPKQANKLQAQAEIIGTTIINELYYVGLLAIEFFVKDGELIANEIAPRVHNSGHLTIEGCNVNQFEQHLRAITNKPLITPAITQTVEMHNIIGEWPTDLSQFQHVYDYGKVPRPNRKLGHGLSSLPLT